jgi:hypothetical protein
VGRSLVAKGRGILQPHDVMTELQKFLEDDEGSELKDGPMGRILMACQVCDSSLEMEKSNEEIKLVVVCGLRGATFPTLLGKPQDFYCIQC